MATSTSASPTDVMSVVVPAGTRFMRVHWSSNGPIWFGRKPVDGPGNRFDAPDSSYGTLYAAPALKAAFAETVLRKLQRIIAWPDVEARSWSELELLRPVTLAMLHGDGLGFHKVTSDITAGSDYTPSQNLSLFFYNKMLDGIQYRSRHNNDELCYALFDRVQPADLKKIATFDFATHRSVAEDFVSAVGSAFDTSPSLPPITSLK